MLGADTWPVDVIPSEDPKGAFDIHNFCLTPLDGNIIRLYKIKEIRK
jgi:hypothetical protein